MSWNTLPEYKLIEICYVQGPVPVCPTRDLVHLFQVPTEKPKAGGQLPWPVVLLADAKQFSRAKGNLEGQYRGSMYPGMLLCPWLPSAVAGVS